MNKKAKLLVGALGVVLVSLAAGSPALAQCGGPVKKVSYPTAPAYRGNFQLASWGGQTTETQTDERDSRSFEPIVGLWKMVLVDKAANYSDQGYSAWHSDGTELYNSERAPATGAICQGVWEKVGRSTYILNHFALAYNGSVAPNPQGQTVPNETAPANIIQIRALVTVGRSRQSFSGSFTLTVFDPSHNPLVTFKGPITGQRITLGTTIDSQ